MLADPRQRVGAPAHDHDHRWCAGRDHCFHEVLLHAGQAEIADVAELAARAVGHEARTAADEAHRDVGRASVGDGLREAPGTGGAHAGALGVGHVAGEGSNAGERRDRFRVVRTGREVAVAFDEPSVRVARLHDLGVRGIRIVALEEAFVVGGRSDHRDPLVGRERQESSLVAQQRERLHRGFACEGAICRPRVRELGGVLVDEWLLEEAERSWPEHATHGPVDRPGDVDLDSTSSRSGSP